MTRNRVSPILAIAIVVALGATATVPVPAAAQTGGSLTGTVTDGESNLVSGVAVTATKKTGVGDVANLQETTTNETGGYAFADLGPGTWTVTFDLDGYAKLTENVTIEAGQSHTHNATLEATWAKRVPTTTGREVLDSETREPIVGALVTLTGHFREGRASRTTTTDDNGQFSIKLYDTKNQVLIEKRGYRSHEYWTTPEDAELDDPASLLMDPIPIQTATVTGRVIDATTGDPVQALVQLFTDWEQAEKEAQAQETDTASSRSSSGQAEPAIVEDHAIVCCRNDNWNQTITAEDGTFTMHAYPGHVVINANRRDHIVAETRIELKEGQTRDITLELQTMPPKSVTISGTVVDAVTGDAIPGANVNLQVPAWSDYEWTHTDADGRFTAEMRAGYTLIDVSYWARDGAIIVHEAEAMDAQADGDDGDDGEAASGSSEGAEGTEPAPAPPREPQGPNKEYYTTSITLRTNDGDQPERTIQLQPKPEPRTRLLGYVVDTTTNTAIADAHVSYYNQATGDWGSATTDADGSYAFTVRTGYSTVHVWIDGYLPAKQNIQVPNTGTARLDLHVEPGRFAQQGWWDPSQQRECCYDEPGVAYTTADSGDDFARAESASDDSASSSQAATFGSDGDRSGAQLDGTGGGLGPYDPNAVPEDNTEAPAVPIMLVVLAGLGGLFVMRRRR